MLRFLRKQSQKAGLPPGTLVHTGEEPLTRPIITVFDYNDTKFEERQITNFDDLIPYRDPSTVSWINIDGITVDVIAEVGRRFGLHPLTTEDVLNTDQRPKVEVFGDYIYVVVRMLQYDEKEGEVLSEQVSLIFGDGFVLSFQETHGDVFDPIRERIRKSQSRIRGNGSDYLIYRLLDALVDGYFYVLEKVGERIDDLEEEITGAPERNTPEAILDLKREIMVLRRNTWPIREVVSSLERSESNLVRESTTVYLRDVYDHAVRVSETVETFREMTTVLLEVYASMLNTRLNEVMKVLTMITTIFIPLSFLAGVYGMNFQHMPEISWKWSYPIFWTVIASVAGTMLYFFRRKRWI
jgi:magnesium transporter